MVMSNKKIKNSRESTSDKLSKVTPKIMDKKQENQQHNQKK